MRKSPIKWIKHVLFGRRKFKSRPSRKHKIQKSAGNSSWFDRQEPSAREAISPVISNPSPVVSSVTIKVEGEQKLASSSATDVTFIPREDASNQRKVPSNELKYAGRNGEAKDSDMTLREGRAREEKAVIKMQAVFRGYRARIAFNALQGIISLQALARGRLVRRQATATLSCMCGIIKLQGLVRGRQLRFSLANIQVSKTFSKDGEHFDSESASSLLRKRHLSPNKFIYRLVSSVPIPKPLQMQYAKDDLNSVWIWLERWTSSGFWKCIPQPTRTIHSKSSMQSSSLALQARSGVSKCNARKVPPMRTDKVLKIGASQPDKKKQSTQKVTSSPAAQVRRQQNEHTKLTKRNLPKMMSPVKQKEQLNDNVEPSMLLRMNQSGGQYDQEKGDLETLVPTSMTPSQADESVIAILDVGSNALQVESTNSAECNVDALLSLDHQSGTLHPTAGGYHVETIRKPHVDILILHEADDGFLPFETITERPPAIDLEDDGIFHPDGNNLDLDPLNENHAHLPNLPVNKWMSSNNEKHSEEILAAIKTASLHIEDHPQSPLTSRSYMACTVSTKAKLRGQGSPKVSPEVVDKKPPTSRGSLLPAGNVKLSTRVGQQTNTGRVKNKLIQAEWKR